MKRLLNFSQTINNDDDDQRKKIKIVTCLEDLSNEIFFEIFDYLDGCDILHGFLNLNQRFKQFLHHSSYLYRIYRYSTYEHQFQFYCQQYLLPHQHQLRSLHLFDQILIKPFSRLFSRTVPFEHLQSLVLIAITPDQFFSLLQSTEHFPRLIHLRIQLIGPMKNLDDLYRLIFNLPILKSLKFSILMQEKQFLFPTNIHHSINSLQRLHIDHDCSIRQLDHLLSYTSNLQHLVCRHLSDSRSILPSRLEHLRTISIRNWNVDFEHFEIFLQQLHCLNLEKLLLNNQSNDLTFLNADRWEALIRRSIPRLQRLNFRFSSREFPSELQKFTGSFWTEHRWNFQIEITDARTIYSIQPYRKHWSDLSTKDFQLITQLTIIDVSLDRPLTLIEDIKTISSQIRITHLYVNCMRLSLVTVMQFLPLLPHLQSWTIPPLYASKIEDSIDEETQLKIREIHLTNVIIDLISDIEQVTFLLDFLPQIKSLAMNCSNNINPRILVQKILSRVITGRTPHLCSLSLWLGQITDELIGKFHRIFSHVNISSNYTIKRFGDRISFQWI